MFEVKMKDDFGWSGASCETLKEAANWFEFDLAGLEWNEIEGGFVAYQLVGDPESEEGPFTFIYQIEGAFTLAEWIEAIRTRDEVDED